MYLVLQHAEKSALFTFLAPNQTWTYAVSMLLKHYNLACRGIGEVPVVELRTADLTKNLSRCLPWSGTSHCRGTAGNGAAEPTAKPDAPMGDLLDDAIPEL